jgi:hypothetical protein
MGGPVLLTAPTALAPPAARWLAASASWIDSVEVVGGTSAVSDAVGVAAARAIS